MLEKEILIFRNLAMNKKITTYFKEARHLLLAAIPLSVATALDVSLSFVDSIFIGHVGMVELAAVGLGGIIVWTMNNFFKGIFLGVASRIAANEPQYGNPNKSYFIAAVLICLLAFVVLNLIFFGLGHHISYFASSDTVSFQAQAYIQIRLLGCLGFFFNIVCFSLFRANDVRKKVLQITFVINVVNIIFNWLFVYIFELGVAGLAWASVVAQYVGALVNIGLIQKSFEQPILSRVHSLVLWNSIKELIRKGFPYSLKIFFNIFVYLIFTVLIGRLGTNELAASTLIFQVISFANIIAIGIGQVAQVKIAADKSIYSIKNHYRLTLVTAGGLAVIIAILFYVFRAEVYQIYDVSHEVAFILEVVFIFGLFDMILDCITITQGYILDGLSDNKFQFRISFILGYFLFLPLVYLSINIFSGQLLTVWLLANCYMLLTFIILQLRISKLTTRSLSRKMCYA